ncbi:hypothetical protein [Companilactobacillus sp.]|jgi:hypothetical protein|uniref:hypothetical protein n=1 Tax=Companilactobacillus sp. TaxID=2767905 RepID=UPI0025C0B13C|nr:hypothetical protein [Companilactobacillus sp.]MCH4009641.1 hypothetical protein [Companilactobacillus sp.]MCH4052683.1 hypothetical protein [Companilactobacillus sp.]MCH4077583.1 hypothetical protein [Companilactobacillus sp.]MCH4126159.1 hypothetical protein [Companilactobacillus sp.]MCI1311867.1 hypothetical protein [Companilactobacillus sp.]
MALTNAFEFSKTEIDYQKLLNGFHNQFRLVSQRPYQSRKVENDNGVILTLQVIKDDIDYGIDKKTSRKRDSNLFNTFDVTILNHKDYIPIKKGEYVALKNFIPDKSFAIGFDLILRFEEVVKLNVKSK